MYTGPIVAPEGYFVVGLRFAKADSVIFLQIKVAKSDENGTIDTSSTRWQLPPGDLRSCVMNITVNERSLMLEDIYFEDQNTFVVGIRMFKVNGLIQLGIYGRKGLKIFFKSGKSGNHLIMDSFKNKVPLFKSKHQFTRTYENILIFDRSSFEQDMGQSFVPHLSTKEVKISPLSLLSGIGLVHLTNDNEYAGVIVPYVRTANSFDSTVATKKLTRLEKIKERSKIRIHDACIIQNLNSFMDGEIPSHSRKNEISFE